MKVLDRLMVCKKCSYRDKKEVVIFGVELCSVCATFAPEDEDKFNEYVNETIDWKTIDSFRRKGVMPGTKQKEGMTKMAKLGKAVTRAACGYTIKDGELIQNEDSVKVHSLFRTFLTKDYSLNSLSKNYSLSVNGLKKILRNRTYLGEIKFNGQLYKSTHKPIITPEIFYAVQRKLDVYLRPRKEKADRYKDLSGESEPLVKEINKIKLEKENEDQTKDENSKDLYKSPL